jgi:hypothetical protein
MATRLADALGRAFDPRVEPAHRVKPGIEAAGRAAEHPRDLAGGQLDAQGQHDFTRDLVLDVEHVAHQPVIALGPDMVPGRGIDELRRDAEPVGAAANAAFEHVAHAKLARDLPHVDRFALVSEARIARDHQEAADFRERGDDVLGKPVGEMLLLGVGAHVLERQDRDRRLFGERGLWLLGRRAIPRRRRHGVIDPDRPRHVLEALLALVGKCGGDLALYLAIGVLGKADAARRRDPFEPCGDVDAVAHEVAVALDHHVAEIDADAEFDAFLGLEARVARRHGALDLDRAAQRVDDAHELDERAVTGAFDDAAAMGRDDGIYELLPERAEPRQRAFLVDAGEPRESRHVRGKDRGQAAFDMRLCHGSSRATDLAYFR